MRRFTNRLACISALVLMFLIPTACKTQLAPGGAYTHSITNADQTVTTTSDVVLYNLDTSFKTAYDSINAAFETEYKNRDYFWKVSPEIKHTLDRIRPQAQQVVNDYAAARTAYLANPTPTNLSGVQAFLAKLQQLLLAASAAVAQSGLTK